jgi:hypothetical protein
MAVRIEDAGFEIRDQIMWVYGSGFPKSLNIGKAVDKLQGNEKFKEQEIGFVKWLKSNLDCYWCSGLGVISDNEEGFGDPSSCLDCNGKGKHTIEDIDGWLGTKAQAFHFFAESDSNRQIPNAETYKILKNRLHLDNRYDDFVKKHSLLLEEIRELQGYEKSIKNWDKKYDKAILNKPKTELASEWEGWGTALKPAHEPIVVARKPIEGTVAENCLKWGVGGINIDGCRVEGNEELGRNNHTNPYGSDRTWSVSKTPPQNNVGNAPQGRFPANLIHDGSDEVVGLFPQTGKSTPVGFKKRNDKDWGMKHDIKFTEFNDSGSAARFFYCAKSSKRERNCGLDGYLTVKYNECISNNKNLCKEENMVAVQLLQKVILEPTVSFSTGESGESIMVQCHRDSLSTILTESKRIIGLKIYNSLTHSLTNESTQDANSEMENGGNLAESVADLKRWILTITKGNQELALGASRVVLKMLSLISEEENWKPATNFHSTVKPIALMEYLIKLVSREGATVLDPFTGSGSTGIACKKLNRQFIGIEREADYVKIANARINAKV